MTRRNNIFFIIFLLLAIAVSSSTLNNKLKNGLEVLIVENNDIPSVGIAITFLAGSRNERPDKKGMAHFIEHLSFNGSPGFPDSSNSIIIKFEREGGICNAETSQDKTTYYEVIPADLLEEALKMEADRMGDLAWNEAAFKMEKEVVKEEYRQSIQNNPFGPIFEKILGSIFENHPYGWTPAGTIEDIDSFKLEEVKAFRKKYYNPCNAILIIEGNVDSETVMGLVGKYFSPIECKEKPDLKINPIKQSANKEIRFKIPVFAKIVGLGYHLPPSNNPDWPSFLVLEKILSEKGGLINEKLVSEKHLAVMTEVIEMRGVEGGYLAIGAVVAPIIQRKKKAMAEINSIISDLKAGNMKRESLERAKALLLAEYEKSKTSLIANLIKFSEGWILSGDFRAAEKEIESIKNISLSDIKSVAERYFTDDNQTIFILTH